MKQFMMTLVAALFISSAAFAHDKDDKDTRKQEMIKHRTERIVKIITLTTSRLSSCSNSTPSMPIRCAPIVAVITALMA